MTTHDATIAAARNAQARRAAQHAVDGMAVGATGLVRYSSRGRVLVIGGEEAQWLATRLEAPLRAEVLLTRGEPDAGAPLTPLAGRRLAVTGHLGAFRVELGEQGRHNHQVIEVDLIADLEPEPCFSQALPPPGYWHLGTEPQELDAAVVELQDMVGTFEKPRYFSYDADICAHSRSGQAGCRQCIDACPAEAIISIGERVEVNPNLCQGGGICATVCPSGAMRYAYPSPADTAERLRAMLRAYREAGGSDALVLFAAEEEVPQLPELPPNVLLCVVEELASVGHELWLAALAWGAGRIVLADSGSVPTRVRETLQRQVAISQAMLRGLGSPAEALCLSPGDAVVDACVPVMPSSARPATFAVTGDKRQLAMLAVDGLRPPAADHPPTVALPPGAPYGRVEVAADRCTLCMGCTSVCPVGALSAGDDTPKLVFHEAKCVQCGICANACPETAIRLEPRLLTDPQQRRQGVVLNEEAPFCCISCGKPFATHRVIDTILGKLAGHAMFQSERARRRLQMCDDCRVVDAVQDEEAMQAGLRRPAAPRNDS